MLLGQDILVSVLSSLGAIVAYDYHVVALNQQLTEAQCIGILQRDNAACRIPSEATCSLAVATVLLTLGVL